MYIYCVCFLCTLTFLHTLSDSNLAEWQLLALFLPDFTCLFNKLFSFSLFPSSLLSVLFSAVLFCLFTHSAAAFEAQLKYLSNFYRRTLSVQIVCCLLQTYCKYTPCTPLAHTPRRVGKVFCVQIAVCLLRTAWNIINAKPRGRGMQKG